MKTYKISLPTFTGFYDNINYLPNLKQIIENICDKRSVYDLKKIEIDEYELDFNFEKYYEAIAYELCKYVQNNCKSFIDENISIKYYTHYVPTGSKNQRDEIICNITCDIDKIVILYGKVYCELVVNNIPFKKLTGSVEENLFAMIEEILEYYGDVEPTLEDLDICVDDFCGNIEELETRDEINVSHLMFKDETNFDECCFFLRNWSGISDYQYIEHKEFLAIEFRESVWNKLLNDLSYSPLVTFEYEIYNEYF